MYGLWVGSSLSNAGIRADAHGKGAERHSDDGEDDEHGAAIARTARARMKSIIGSPLRLAGRWIDDVHAVIADDDQLAAMRFDHGRQRVAG